MKEVKSRNVKYFFRGKKNKREKGKKEEEEESIFVESLRLYAT